MTLAVASLLIGNAIFNVVPSVPEDHLLHCGPRYVVFLGEEFDATVLGECRSLDANLPNKVFSVASEPISGPSGRRFVVVSVRSVLLPSSPPEVGEIVVGRTSVRVVTSLHTGRSGTDEGVQNDCVDVKALVNSRLISQVDKSSVASVNDVYWKPFATKSRWVTSLSTLGSNPESKYRTVVADSVIRESYAVKIRVPDSENADEWWDVRRHDSAPSALLKKLRQADKESAFRMPPSRTSTLPRTTGAA